MDNDFEVQSDHPELIALCLNCKYPECIGKCRAYNKKMRELILAGKVRTRPRSSIVKLPSQRRVGGRSLFEYKGQWLTVLQLAEQTGLSAQKLYYRLVQTNGDAEMAVDDKRFASRKPYGSNMKYYTARGETHTLAEWAAIIGVPRKRLYDRVNRGCTMEEALNMGVWAGHGRKAVRPKE